VRDQVYTSVILMDRCSDSPGLRLAFFIVLQPGPRFQKDISVTHGPIQIFASTDSN
jgi:hypothetical protein